MKIQFLIDSDDNKVEWRDKWIDEKFIAGFYLPDYDPETSPCINMDFVNYTMTVKSTTELVAYLQKRFDVK